jgi:hypothetical protein
MSKETTTEYFERIKKEKEEKGEKGDDFGNYLKKINTIILILAAIKILLKISGLI